MWSGCCQVSYACPRYAEICPGFPAAQTAIADLGRGTSGRMASNKLSFEGDGINTMMKI